MSRLKKIKLTVCILAGVLVGGVIGTALLMELAPAEPVVSGQPTATPSAYDGANARATLFARHATTPDSLEAALFNPTVTPTSYSTGVSPSPTPALNSDPSPVPTATPTQAEIRKAQLQSQLSEAWASYKQHFIQGDGRVVDPQSGGITTSEGQSYALLRSVWLDDREVFDRVLSWTQNNLQIQPNSKLFAYKWGKAEDGSWQVLDGAGASDADSDIALALVFASKRWQERKYQNFALEILASIWDKEIVRVQGRPYLTAGEWAPRQSKPALNPSYLSPYAMRIFAGVDPTRNWSGLVDTSYEVIRGCSEVALDGVASAKLPANWCGIDRQSGKLTVAQDYPTLNTNYGYDAFRTMWRVALDYRWFGEKRALDYLVWSDTLRQKWKQEGKLVAEYDYGGRTLQNHEDLAVYGGNLANFVLTEPELAEALVDSKLRPAYQNQGNNGAGWGDLQNYYTQNWAWFGLAFYLDRLPDLAPPNAKAAPVQQTPVATNR
jgi:endoglucanase